MWNSISPSDTWRPRLRCLSVFPALQSDSHWTLIAYQLVPWQTSKRMRGSIPPQPIRNYDVLDYATSPSKSESRLHVEATIPPLSISQVGTFNIYCVFHNSCALSQTLNSIKEINASHITEECIIRNHLINKNILKVRLSCGTSCIWKAVASQREQCVHLTVQGTRIIMADATWQYYSEPKLFMTHYPTTGLDFTCSGPPWVL